MQKQNIIAATDFSKKSFEVIKKAYAFAQTRDACLHIVHVVEENFFQAIGNRDQIRQYGLKKLQKEFEWLQPENFHCQIGEVAHELEEYVKQLQASMVVLGASGEDSAIKEFFLGSSTKDIVRSVSVPCLVVKTPQSLQYRDILVATDLSEASAKHIEKLSTLFPKANLHLLYTYFVPFESRLNFYGMGKDQIYNFQQEIAVEQKAFAREFYRQLPVKESQSQMIVAEGHLAPDLFVQKAQSVNAGLIALHTTGRVSFFAFDMLSDAKNDVFIYKL